MLDENVLRKAAREFFEKDENHIIGDDGDDLFWLPELAEDDAFDYLMRFAKFMLLHPDIQPEPKP